MASLRTLGLLVILIGLGAASSPMAYAEWWKLYAPKDFEECSQGAEQPGLSKDAQAKIISECDSKFAGRRKAGGGYTYFDFMQNRHFDIAGPNPTPQELKRMDQDYLAYLETNPETPTEVVDTGQALAAITNQMKPVVDQKPAVRTKATAGAVETPPAASPARVRKKDVCKDDALSCGLAKITDTVKSLKHAVLGADAGVKRPPSDLSRSRPAGGA